MMIPIIIGVLIVTASVLFAFFRKVDMRTPTEIRRDIFREISKDIKPIGYSIKENND